jgi:hypothetical protein
MSITPQNVIRHKDRLLTMAAELGNLSRACKLMEFSSDTFYRYQSAMITGSVEGTQAFSFSLDCAGQPVRRSVCHRYRASQRTAHTGVKHQLKGAASDGLHLHSPRFFH